MASKARSEAGQVIVILALAFVGLLGFAALAIDTGMIYTDRRADQNAGDAAALAGIQQAMQTAKNVSIDSFQCDTGGNWVINRSGWSAPAWLTQGVLDSVFTKAISTAQKNAITLEVGLAHHNGVAFRCGKNNGRNFLEVRTEVTTQTNTSFLQIFYGGKVKNTVEAVAIGYPSQPSTSGFALYGLDPNCSNTGGVNLNGGGNASPNVRIENGGAYSRSCMISSGHGSIYSDTANSCLYNDAHPDWCNENDANFVPKSNNIYSDALYGTIPEPDCNHQKTSHAQTYSGPTMSPGYYGPGNFEGSNSSKIDGHDQYKLKPGLYCFDIGSGSARLAFNGGGSMTSIEGDGYSKGVTIVIMSGSLDASGGGGMDLWAANPNGTGGPFHPDTIPGLVLMAASTSTNTNLTLGGNSGSKLWGTVFIPKGIIDLGGTGDVRVATEFIAFGFRHHGTATAYLNYDADYFYQAPPSISLKK